MYIPDQPAHIEFTNLHNSQTFTNGGYDCAQCRTKDAEFMFQNPSTAESSLLADFMLSDPSKAESTVFLCNGCATNKEVLILINWH